MRIDFGDAEFELNENDENSPINEVPAGQVIDPNPEMNEARNIEKAVLFEEKVNDTLKKLRLTAAEVIMKVKQEPSSCRSQMETFNNQILKLYT